MITFAIHGYEGVNPAREFPCRIFRSTRLRPFRSSPKRPTKMRNRDGAEFTVEVTCQHRSFGRGRPLRLPLRLRVGRQPGVEQADTGTAGMAAAGPWTDRGLRTRSLLQEREVIV